MTEADHKFLHDIMNKLAKISGFTEMLKSDLEEGNIKILKIEKAAQEAIDVVEAYRALLEKEDQSSKLD